MNDTAIYERKPLTAQEIQAQVNIIQTVMKQVMKEGEHFGTLPGCKKPSLYKPGSEKILSTFHIAVIPGTEDVVDLSGDDYFRYRVHVRGATLSGELIGIGIGECSTDEEKYKWRTAVCKEEYDSTPEDRRRMLWKKADKYHSSPYQVTQVRTNPADLANTVLKMAKKRGQIDLTLTATAASDIFTQDIEDVSEELRDNITEGQQRDPIKPPQSKSGAPSAPENGKSPRESLLKELAEYCGKDMAKFKKTLKEITAFGDNKGTDDPAKLSDKWAASALGKLRAKVKEEGGTATKTDADPEGCPQNPVECDKSVFDENDNAFCVNMDTPCKHQAKLI